MPSAVSLFCALSPPRRLNLERWFPVRLIAAPSGAGVTDAEAVTAMEYAWGYAIRREWPDGAHDLFGFAPDQGTAQSALERDRGYWRSGPVRPTTTYLVAASAADVDRHPTVGCRRSCCPDSPERGQQ
ncbi:hypothetical protein AB0B10_25590 [Micromonospora arborensis]|uniref:hypothetical protein n=1 Tax=Micromonospora arborensis TaxID=2116518 RepID=UPI0033EF56F5